MITKTLKNFSGTGGQNSNIFGRSDHWMTFDPSKTWQPGGVASFPYVPT